MKAEIRYSGFDFKASVKLKPFLPIARHFAEKWKKRVFLDAPCGPIKPKSYGKDESVRIHFFSCPDSADASELKAQSLCSINLPQDEKLSGFKCSAIYTCIRSPENTEVAQVIEDTDIYILFDLARCPWPGAQLIFWEILERISLYIYQKKGGQESEESKKEADDKSYSGLKSFISQREEELFRKFAQASVFLLEREELSVRKNLEEQIGLMIADEEELSRIRMRIEMLDILIEKINDDEGNENELRKEFETIHKLKGVLGLRTNEGRLLVYTEPIEHSVGSPDEGRVLSQHIIRIDPSFFDGSRAVFMQFAIWDSGWESEYYHPGIADSAFSGRCLGGLEPSVEKARADRDFLAVINLALLYLDSDNRSPMKKNAYKRAPNKKKISQFYASEEEKEAACRAYIRMVSNYRGKYQKDLFGKELSELKKKEKSRYRSWIAHRKNATCFGITNMFLQDFARNIPLKEEFRKLVLISELVFIEIWPDFIGLVFAPGPSKGNGKKIDFPGTLRMVIDIKSPTVFVLNSIDSNTEAYLTERMSWVEGKKKPGNESDFCREVRRGRVGSAIEMIFGYLRGSGKVKSGAERRGVFSRKEVERFLCGKVFPRSDRG